MNMEYVDTSLERPAVKIVAIESAKTRRIKLVMNVFAILIACLFLFPFYWLLINSFKTELEVFSKVTYWPQQWTIKPWQIQFQDKDFFRSLRNSFTIASLAMTVSFVLGVPAAYGIGRFAVPGKKGILLTFLVTQMMPASLLLTPLYLTFTRMQLLNSYLAPALAVASGSIPFIVVTLRPYFLSVPKSLDDAARIDGCNAVTSFFLIMVPVIRTGLITIIVISFLHGWNDLIYSMTFNVSADMRPLTANIYKFMDKYGLKWNNIMAYGVILVTPVTLMFVFLQKYIIGGLTSGAVKE